MTAITSLGASELAHRIRQGQLSPIEVIEAHIQQIEATHPAINALVTPAFDTARQAAQQATAELAQGQNIGPLHGVPLTVKDSLDVADVRATCGLVARANHLPSQDATVVARLRAAGAIVLGKTNTPDNCGGYETYNLLFGQTNNPWDVTCSVGGSTGGEAALIAAGGSPLGIGTDIAGSIRLPCHCTGIVGLRPTSATLPEDGQWPAFTGRAAGLEAIGPLARRVEDVALAFAIMNGEPPLPLDHAIQKLHRMPIAHWFDDGLTPSSSAVRSGVRAAVQTLQQQAGMIHVDGAPAARRLATLGWTRYFQSHDLRDWERGFGGGANQSKWSTWSELVRRLQGRPQVSWEPFALWLFGLALGNRVLTGIDGARWRKRLQTQLYRLLGEEGIAVCPVFPTTAPRHGWNRRRSAALLTSNYTTWVNLAGLPALALPVGRSARRGLPVGVQLVGMPGTEQTLLAAGLVIQQTLSPHWSGPMDNDGK